MTFEEIMDQVIDICSEDKGGEFETMVKRQINEIYLELQEAVGTDVERREFSFTTVASTSKYGMPLYVREIVNLEDGTATRQLSEISAYQFDQEFPAHSDSGPPMRWYRYGTFSVQTQPSTAGTITVESSSATDTGSNYKVTIRGFSSGVEVREELTLTGTSAVTSTNSYDADSGIERIILNPRNNVTFTGNVIVKDNAGNTISTFPPYWGKSPAYQWIELHPTPSDARAITVRCWARKPSLVNDDDWPEAIPERYHDLLYYGTAALLLPHVGKLDMADRYTSKFRRRMEDFLGGQQKRPRMRRQLAEISNIVSSDRPRRPRIEGVHY